MHKLNFSSDRGAFDASGAGSVAASTLAATGLGSLAGASGVWLFVASFTLISAGFAVLRIIPRKEG